MGDHFVLLVDRLLTESTLEAAIESRNLSCQVEKAVDLSEQILTESVPIKRNCINGSSGGKLVQCRICHDEDEDCSMETPCSCCGSLKYAHRKCVQRWCNEKGDTMCEICLQEFKPGYTAPPQLFHYGGVPMNFRGNWEISRQDLHNPRFFAADRSFSDSNYDDYAASTARSVLYCRSVAVIFVVLLVLRHTLPIIIGGDQQYSLTVFAIMILRIAGILVPVYVMARALSVFHHRRHRLQDTRELPAAMSESDDEQTDSSPQMQPQPHVIQIQ